MEGSSPVPATVDVIDSITNVPLASLQQVLDTGGPYGPGSHTLTDFTTAGAFLLPAGTYPVSGTYGVIVQVNGAIPPESGYMFGWNDAALLPSGDTYFDRFAQLALLHFLPITGAAVVTQLEDVRTISQLFLWPILLLSPAKIGLWVAPNMHIDLFYMCVL
jgi:hypothetical protein